MPRRIKVPVEFSGLLTIGLRRNHGLLSSGGQRPDDPFVSIERFVRDQHARLHVRNEFIGASQIMDLPSSEMEPNRIAQYIHQGMNFRAQ